MVVVVFGGGLCLSAAGSAASRKVKNLGTGRRRRSGMPFGSS